MIGIPHPPHISGTSMFSKSIYFATLLVETLNGRDSKHNIK
jgi:hypothetical protein